MTFYFGCWKDTGHYIYNPSGRESYYGYIGPFDVRHLDETFAPRRAPDWSREAHGATNVAHTNGWTVLAMWDNSIDKRPGSHCAFFTEGAHDEAQMWTLAERDYGWLVPRLVAYQNWKASSTATPTEKGKS